MVDVVIADDMNIIRESLKMMLSDAGFNIVDVVDSCSDVLQVCKKKKFDVLLLDLLGMNSFSETMKKEIDSFDVITYVTKHYKKISIIVITANQKDEYLDKALKLGAKAWLIKGDEPEKIISTVKNIAKKDI